MKKILIPLLSIICLFSCTEKTLTDQIVPKRENSHYLSLETRSSIKIEELPDGYDFNGDKISDAGVCVLCGFNHYRSKQLASILLHCLWEKKLYVYGNN